VQVGGLGHKLLPQALEFSHEQIVALSFHLSFDFVQIFKESLLPVDDGSFAGLFLDLSTQLFDLLRQFGALLD